MKPESAVVPVEAGWVGRAFAADPDLHVPRRPRLIPELLVELIPPDGVLFFGASEPQVLRGTSARTHLVRLLPLLDGTRTIEEIAARDGRLSGKDVWSVVALLHSRGLLEDGRGEEPTGSEERELSSWLGRFVDATQLNANRAQSWRRLQASRVDVLGGGRQGDRVAALLRRSGIGAVREAQSVSDDASAVVIVGDEIDVAGTGGLREGFLAGKQRLLALLSTTGAVFAPPLVQGHTACHRCFAEALLRASAGAARPVRAPEVLFGLAVHYLTVASSGIGVADHASASVYSEEDGRLERRQLACAPVPGCADCCPATVAPGQSADARLAMRFHLVSSFPTRSMLAPKAHQHHYRIGNIKLARERQPSAWARAVLLTDLAEEPAPSPRLSLATLAALLRRTAGCHRQDGELRRVAPTGGDLGSPQLFVAARRVEGLAAGLYRYDGHAHALDLIDSQPGSLGLDEDARAECIVVALGDADKAMRKYQGFGLRLVHLDAGVALAFLVAAARALRLEVFECRRYAPRQILDALRISEGSGLLPTLVLAIGAEPRPGAPAIAASVAHQEADLAAELGWTEEVVPQMMEACRAPRTGHHAWQPLDTVGETIGRGDLTALDELLLRRRTCRDVDAERLRGGEVVRVAETARRALQARASASQPCSVAPRLYVTATLPDLAANVYAPGPHADQWQATGRAIDAETMRELVIQDSFARAPAALTLGMHLSRALAIGTGAVTAYTDALVDAGFAVGSMWLEAVALGLAGCPAGAVLADPAHASSELVHELPLMGFFFGRSKGR